jgi:hypothetical protein
MSKSSNTGFWVVIAIAVVGAAGYWYYDKYLKTTVTTSKTLGIL